MSEEKPKFGETLKEDWKNTQFRSSFKRDYGDVEDFFFDDDERAKLSRMGSFKKLFYRIIWLFKKLFYKLTPFRRLLFIAGTILIFASRNDQQNNLGIIGGLVLLFLVLLELKDKLIAKTELEEGRAVQTALMPERIPEIPGWSVWLYTRPANDVGGDLIDFQKLEGDNYGISLGDISGKGLSAALLMAKLQASIRALVLEYSSTAKMIEKINNIFYYDTPQNSFASLIYFRVSSESEQIEYVNAGHLPPIILKPDSLDELPKGLPALGLMKDLQYKQETFTLTKNDILISFSDGLTEAENNNGEFYGKEKALQLFSTLRGKSVSVIGETILADVENFIGEAKTHDDISIIVIKKL